MAAEFQKVPPAAAPVLIGAKSAPAASPVIATGVESGPVAASASASASATATEIQPTPAAAAAAAATPATAATTVVAARRGLTKDRIKKRLSADERNDLDIAYFFSAPLVHEQTNHVKVEIPMLSVTQEMKALRSALKCDRDLRFISAIANVASFTTTLTKGVRVVHFSAHGLKGQITFETAYGKLHPIFAKDLMDIFCAGGRAANVQLVFVSACHSEDLGRAFLDCGVPVVVAVDNDHAVLDRASIQFARGFYDALVQGHTAKEAFEIGKTMVQHDAHLGQLEEHKKFILLGKPEFQNKKIFPDLPKGNFIDCSNKQSTNHCFVPDAAFVGRALLVQETFETLERRRCVVLAGPKGIGKTQVALMACKYAAERSRYKEIFCVHLHEGKAGTLLQRFAHALKVSATDKLTFGEELEKFRSGRYLVLVDGFNRDTEAKLAATSASDDPDGDVTLGQLLRTMMSTTEDMHFLITHTTDMPLQSPTRLRDENVNHRILSVPPLTAHHAALAFCKHAARNFKLSEFSRLGVSANEDPMAVFSKSAIIRDLGGNPLLIGHVATAVSALNLVTQEARILQEIIPAAKAKLFGSPIRLHQSLLKCFDNDNEATMLWMSLGMRTTEERVPWTQLGAALQQHFAKVVGDTAANARPLSDADIKFIGAQKFGIKTIANVSGAPPIPTAVLMVPPQLFAAFWKQFWKPWIAMLQHVLDLWTSTVRIIAGFVHDRVMLEHGREGTFMIRFSFSDPKTLVCVYLDQENRLQKTKIYVDSMGGKAQFRVHLSGAMVIREYSMDRLIMRIKIWRTLFPDHPKETVFVASPRPPPAPPQWGEW